MRLLFSQLPGRHERHLMRKHENVLFPESERLLTLGQLTEAQRLDHEELVQYIGELRKLVSEAIALGPHEQSDVILDLKERLDKAYEKSCRLADDQTPNKDAIQKLIGVIMQSVWKGAGSDSFAQRELEQEGAARQAHYELLEYPLVADLLDPDSLIKADELLPSLLSANDGEFAAALSLFDEAQLVELRRNAQELRARLSEDELAAVQNRYDRLVPA